MNKTHSSRKRDIELYIKMAILKGDLKRAIDLCERYSISSKEFGKLAREVASIG